MLKVIPKKKKDKVSAEIMQAMVNKYMKEHPMLLEDIYNLAVDMTAFQMKYGKGLNIESFFKKPFNS